jgi:serine/threonine-protein kinase
MLDQFQEEYAWYKAPEEFETKSTERSIVYRLGLITYELLTGELPYTTYPDGTPKEAIKANDLVQLSEKDTNLSPELNRILAKSLSKSPKDRYETVLHFRDDLRSLNNN